MRKSARSHTTKPSRERVVFVDILRQQLLDLEALRKEVAEAEARSTSVRNRMSERERLSFAHVPKGH